MDGVCLQQKAEWVGLAMLLQRVRGPIQSYLSHKCIIVFGINLSVKGLFFEDWIPLILLHSSKFTMYRIEKQKKYDAMETLQSGAYCFGSLRRYYNEPFKQCSGSVTFWVRIRIRGSVPLVDGSESRSSSFSSAASFKMSTKNKFFLAVG